MWKNSLDLKPRRLVEIKQIQIWSSCASRMTSWIRSPFLRMITNWFGIFDRKKYRYELSQWWNRKFKEMPAAPTGISYRPGDIILDELPYAASVSSDSISYVCSLCFSSTATELCGGCQKVVYCSEECKVNNRQKRDQKNTLLHFESPRQNPKRNIPHSGDYANDRILESDHCTTV